MSDKLTDPIDAFKITKKPKPEEVKKVAVPLPAPQPVEVQQSTCRSYRVKGEIVVSINGCLTHLMAGQTVDEQRWGIAAIPRLLAQGVVLEEIVRG